MIKNEIYCYVNGFLLCQCFIAMSLIYQSSLGMSMIYCYAKCLIDRSFKICDNWNSFHNDIENIKSNLIKNAYPPFLIDKVIKKYLDYKFSSNQNQLKDKSDIHYFKQSLSTFFHTTLKKNFQNFAKSFLKKILTLR